MGRGSKAKVGKSFQFLEKRWQWAILVFSIGTIMYLTIDYMGPARISLKEDQAFGFSCLRARDLIVQETDRNGNLWATRGMIVYKLEKGNSKFIKEGHIPTGLNVFWLRNFTLVRRITIRPECVEMTVTDRGDLCALSAGRIWVRHAGTKKFVDIRQVENYGFGDQGVRNVGIISVGDSTVYIGEYFQNPDKKEVKIFRSTNQLKSWDVAHLYKPDQIRHVHAILNDPFGDRLWVCTGDLNRESMVAWTDDDFTTLNTIGSGSQIWRVCQLVFTESSVYWGTDTGSDEVAGIYSWDRQTGESKRLIEVDGAIFYGTRLEKGTIVMSSDREGMKNEKDDRTRLYIFTDESKITTIDCGTWDHHKPGFWFKFAKLRFQRNQGDGSLVISCLNQKEFPDGDLLIIHEDELLKAVSD